MTISEAKFHGRTATLRTASVDVQVMRLEGKQVTLAVFRQLVDEHVIDLNGDLRGHLWGIVNYHPDRCGDNDGHLHVVFERDGELRRGEVSTVDRPQAGRLRYYKPLHDACLAMTRARLRDALEIGDQDEWIRRVGWMTTDTCKNLTRRFETHEHDSACFVATLGVQDHTGTWTWYFDISEVLEHDTRGGLHRMKVDTSTKILCNAPDANTAQELFVPAMAAAIGYTDRLLESYKAVDALDQIFIAI